MKKISIFTVLVIAFLLNGCAQTIVSEQADNKQQPKPEQGNQYEQKIEILSHNFMASGDATPVSFRLTPAMQPDDVLILRHKDNVFARVALQGQIKLKQISLRFRAMGSGDIVALLHKKDGSIVAWHKKIEIEKYGPIPKFNEYALKKRERVQNGALKMLVTNSSAEQGYIKKVTADFKIGQVIIYGSKYLSRHPYFAIYPEEFSARPEVSIELAP